MCGNVALGGPDVADNLPGFTVKACWNNPGSPVCLARTDRKTCRPDPAFELNNVKDLGRMSTSYGADLPLALTIPAPLLHSSD